ncbi:MAG: CARDB domain-containing protein, partial [bacterium]
MKYQDYLQGGESLVVTRSDYLPEIGSYTASVTADALNIVIESDEGNNTATDTYSVADWDSDDDGVPDPLDLCPFESALNFDSDGDGCIDEGAGGRHVEYWDRPEFPIVYYINENGAPGVSDGSDFTAIHNAMNAWTDIPGTDASVVYGGTTPQKNAGAMDGINLVTFEDTEFQFGLGVLAVGITTSFTEPTVVDHKWYRPGQIYESDMIFNRSKSFRTLT